MNNAPIKDNTREYGPREKITCNLPHPPRSMHGIRYESGVKGESTITESILHDLETALCQQFGGYTSTPSVGGWMDSDGNVMHESGTLYTVSYHLRHDESLEPKRDAAIALFTEAGERLGEEWIHIERSDFQAEHRKTSVSTNGYDNTLAVENERHAESHGLTAELEQERSNISKIRQLDKPTRDHINNPGRATEFVRR